VGIDRGGAYQRVVTKEIPKADIVFNTFHLVANLNEAIDAVRRLAWNEADENQKHFIKGQRYNLFRAWDRQTTEQQWTLRALLDAHENLNVAYVLKEAFGHVWDYVSAKAAENYLRTWVSLAEDSGLPALQRFARGVWRARAGVIAFCRHKVTNAHIEAFNNQIARVLHTIVWSEESAILVSANAGSIRVCKSAVEPKKRPKERTYGVAGIIGRR
jgi:transposase